MRFLPKTLGGQLLVLLLVALLVAQVVIVLVFTDDRMNAVREADRSGLLEGMVSVMRILTLAPPDRRAESADAAGTRRIRYWTSEESAVSNDRGQRTTINFPPALERLFGIPFREPPRMALLDSERQVVERPQRPRPGRADPRPARRVDRYDVLVSVPFPDQGWLNAETRITAADPVGWPWPSTIYAALMALAIIAIVGVTARRVTRPLGQLAERAEALGRGSPSEPVAENGPQEVRRLTAAFNRMQERLGRFIGDRTRMLAAIGHDLRTPITSLRLRAELVDDDDLRTKMVATLDEMERMAEATLTFAREDAEAEPARPFDLNALVASLADDLAAMGRDVTFTDAGRIVYTGRSTALKRAIGNLVDNAVRYGQRARIGLAATPAGPVITVDDDGPGIPPEQMEEVFKPFVRLDPSRSGETGGSGLGLSIARSIVLAHGGDLTLANRPEGGLRAEIRLPGVDAPPA